MRSRNLPILLILGILLVLAGCSDFGEPGGGEDSSNVIVIRNGLVITATGSEPIRNGIVTIERNRIIYVGEEKDFSIPRNAQVLDAGGGSILPGIIDAHTHGTSDPAVRRDFLEGGVTTVCDLGSPLSEMPQFDQAIVGEDPVARGLKAGPILTAPGGLPGAVLGGGLNYEVATPEEGRAAVEDLHRQGASMIKVYLHQEVGGISYPMLDEATLAAIVEKAHAMGLPVRAHVTYASLLKVAVAAGTDSIDHVPINSTQAETVSGSDDPTQLTFDEAAREYEVQLQKMVEANIVFVPTLERPYGDLFRRPSRTPEESFALEIILAIVGRFNELGGAVGLGTDFNISTNIEAGMPIGEMEMLLAAGLTPMEILEAGTRNSAAACGQSDELGTLEVGKLADVIVVDGNPLEDITLLDRVILVVKDGIVSFTSDEILEINE
jgi:imidazolonepropionase-like amidohydrolase